MFVKETDSKQLKNLQDELNKKEALLKDREFNLELSLLKVKLEASEKVSNSYYFFLSELMKNPRAIEIMNTVHDYSLSWNGSQEINKHSISTTEKNESK